LRRSIFLKIGNYKSAGGRGLLFRAEGQSMFDSVLNHAGAPRRRIGTGAAFAVAFHAWLLVAAVAHTGPFKSHDKPPEVTLDLKLAAPPGPPPPLGGGGGSPPKAKSPGPKRAAPNPLRPPSQEPRPAATSAPEAEPAPDVDGEPGDGEGGGGGGSGSGTGSGGDPNGVPGGTGTAPAGPPPPTVLTLNIGDAALDQSTCEISGQPPYPKEAIAQKIEGVVLARCMVEPSGSLSGCMLLKAPYSFEAPVKTFLAGAHARPFTSRGKPARVQCNFKFSYKLAQ
jgi:hypothetical protein